MTASGLMNQANVNKIDNQASDINWRMLCLIYKLI